MSKFNLEAAKRGEPVQIKGLKEWVDAHFVGVDVTGKFAVIEYNNIFSYRIEGNDEIRMKPKQRQMWCFPYKDFDRVQISRAYTLKDDAESSFQYKNNRLGNVQMILVDEE